MKKSLLILLTMVSLTTIVKAQCPPNAFAFESQYPQCPQGCGVLLKDWPEGVIVNIYGGSPLSIITSAVIPGTYGGPGIGNAFVCVPCNVPLVYASAIPGATNGCVIVTLGVVPVQLTSFTVTPGSNGGADLFKWSVTNETGGSKYIIQKSIDGTNYVDVLTIAGGGGNNKNYSQSLPSSNTASQYRLKVVDITGKITYSQVVLVKQQNSQAISIYPNPVINDFKVAIPATMLPATIQVLNAQGQMVHSIKTNNAITSLLPALPTGVYAVRVTGSNASTITQTLVKK